MVKANVVQHTRFNHYSLLRNVENYLGLGTLEKNDQSAAVMDGVWK